MYNKVDYAFGLLMAAMVCILFVVGCDEIQQAKPAVLSSHPNGTNFSITEIGNPNSSGRWNLVELKYKEKTYVFLRHNYGDCQSMVKVEEFVNRIDE